MSKISADTSPPQITLDAQLCFALYSASNRIDDLYRPLLEQHDLTYPQYIALMSLTERDGISISELAHKLGLSKATMTPLLRRLEAKGFLSRDPVPGNDRQKCVRLTPQGRAIWNDSCVVTEKVFAQSHLSQKQANELIALCKIITSR